MRGGFSGGDTHMTRVSESGGWLDRRHHTNKWNRERLAKIGERGDRCGIAGDDNDLSATIEDETGSVSRKLLNLRRRPNSIRTITGVTIVDKSFVRQFAQQFFQDRQSANTRIEDADWRIPYISHRWRLFFHFPGNEALLDRKSTRLN